MKKQYKSLYPYHVPAPDGRPVNYCGIRCSLEVLGGKWKLLVLTHLFRSPLRYHALRAAIPEISERMLVASLRELEEHGLVTRHETAGSPPRVEYAVSEYGQTVRPVVEVLYNWGETHIARCGNLLFG
jgi:DNA-binding HxlR family transcriptional regulator